MRFKADSKIAGSDGRNPGPLHHGEHIFNVVLFEVMIVLLPMQRIGWTAAAISTFAPRSDESNRSRLRNATKRVICGRLWTIETAPT